MIERHLWGEGDAVDVVDRIPWWPLVMVVLAIATSGRAVGGPLPAVGRLVAVGAASTAQSVTEPGTTTTAMSVLDGYGATAEAWDQHHSEDADYGGQPAYGPEVRTPRGPVPQYSYVSMDARVYRFVKSIPTMPLAEAKAQVLADLPVDAVSRSFRLAVEPTGRSCAFWSLTSAALAAVGVGGSDGRVVVQLAHLGAAGTTSWKPDAVNLVSFRPAIASVAAGCQGADALRRQRR